jgi:hypothetical protein
MEAENKPLREVVAARGHRNVTARHRTTLEITREDHLTPQGDCIIAVSADRCFQDFSPEFLTALKDEKTRLEITISCEDVVEKITACGSQHLTFTNPHEMVVRKSEFVCGRTLAVKADKAACDLSRAMVKKLAQGLPVKVELALTVTR